MTPAFFILQNGHPVPTGKFAAIAVGCVGIILVSVSGIGLAAKSEGHCGYKYVTTSDRNETSVMEVREQSINATNVTGATVTMKIYYCTPFTATDLATALLALSGGSLMWSVSSSKLSWSAAASYYVSRWSLSLQYNFFLSRSILCIWVYPLPNNVYLKIMLWTL